MCNRTYRPLREWSNGYDENELESRFKVLLHVVIHTPERHLDCARWTVSAHLDLYGMFELSTRTWLSCCSRNFFANDVRVENEAAPPRTMTGRLRLMNRASNDAASWDAKHNGGFTFFKKHQLF